MVLTMRATASDPSAAMPIVMTAWPWLKFFRSSSLSARMRSVCVDLVSVVIVVTDVIGEVKANPFAATLPPTADGPGDGVGSVGRRGRRRPRGHSWLLGPPFSGY